MKLSNTLVTAGALVALGTAAQAQALNEIYASHTSTDDQEYIEIIGSAGTNLNGHAILIVEGEGAGAGTLDRAWDLSGLVIPNDGGGVGYIVVGDTAVANLDLDVGASNTIENGTETIYLVQTDNFAALSALVGSDVDTDDDCNTEFAALCGCSVTILDAVTMTDTGLPDGGDVQFDSTTTIGPDGTFFPAGIFRKGDFPGDWCDDSFLDFDDVANASEPRTPGAANTAVCAEATPGHALCFGVGCPCANDDGAAGCANSTGLGGVLTGAGTRSVSADDLVLTASQLPPNNNGLFYMGDKPVKNMFFDGFQCALGRTARFLNQIQSTGTTGTMTLSGIVAEANAAGPLIVPGGTWYFHAWFRDVPGSPCGTGANLTHLYKVTFIP